MDLKNEAFETFKNECKNKIDCPDDCCELCQKAFEAGQQSKLLNEKMNPVLFKKKFKVGDVITCWSTHKPAKITAIGDNRILYVCDWDNEKRKPAQVNQIEHVASMFHDWRFLNNTQKSEA